jgi:hypothetical protein
VDLVMIDGDLAYARADWMDALAAPTDRDALEPLEAWGKAMAIDTSYSVKATPSPAPKLADLRRDLVETYPPVGPILA